MRNRMLRLTESEHQLLEVAQKLVRKYGTDKVKCEKCGWKPQINDTKFGDIILAGTNLLLHWIQNPECLEFAKKERDKPT